MKRIRYSEDQLDSTEEITNAINLVHQTMENEVESLGIEMARMDKKINKKVAVIMVSAVDPLNTVIGALKMGAADYIHKPFSVEELSMKISAVLDRK